MSNSRVNQMLLRIARSQRRSWIGTPRYVVTAQLDCSPADLAIINGHHFNSHRVFTAPRAFELAERAAAAHERAMKISVWRASNAEIAQLHWENFKTLALAIRSRVAFHVTLADLLAGTVVQSKHLADVLEAEAALIEAFDNLKRAVEHARTFQDARELLLVPDDDQDKHTPPADWPRAIRH